MGSAQFDVTQLDLGHPQDVTLELKDPARPKQHLGEISLTATLWPRNQQEKEQVGSDFLLGCWESLDRSDWPVPMPMRAGYVGDVPPYIVTSSCTWHARRILRAQTRVSTMISIEPSVVDRFSPASLRAYS